MTATAEILGAEAARLRRAAELVAQAGARVPGHDPGALAFGADASGGLGALAGRMRGNLQAGLDIRAREAAAHAARLMDLADALRAAASGYTDIDDEAGRRAAEGA